MRQYNIPHLWRRDIATCGTFPDAFSRNLLWYDWTDVQKESAASRYNPVFDRLEEFCKLKQEHYKYLGDTFCAAFFSISNILGIDCSKQYTCAELLKLVDDAIAKENKSYEEELSWIYAMSIED